jgi:hypothetical protein
MLLNEYNKNNTIMENNKMKNLKRLKVYGKPMIKEYGDVAKMTRGLWTTGPPDGQPSRASD